MKVVLIGKERVSGVSKRTGKPFDNVVAHINRPDMNATGMVGDTVWLSPDKFPLESLVLNATYELDRDGRGYAIAFQQCK